MNATSLWVSAIIRFGRNFSKPAVSLLLHPSAFFRNLPQPHLYLLPPLGFLSIALVADGIWNALLSKLGWLSIPDLQGLSHVQNIFLNYASLLLSPALLWGTARLFGGKGSFRVAVAVVCYASAPLLLPPVLWLGYVWGFYELFLLYLGMKEVFALSVKKSVFAFLLFAFSLCLASVAVMALIMPG